MRMKSLILIFIALGCGLVASIGISQVLQGSGTRATPQLEMAQILVALSDIDINAKLDASNVKLEEWPKMKVPEGAITSLNDVENKFALQRFYKGEPIIQAKISDSTDNSATRIPEGFRVMPVRIEEDTVLKGIAPGDRVDVNVFLRRSEEVLRTGTHTILRNVRVFAVGSNTERSVDDKGKEIQARTVSLLVKPDQARELAMAGQIGKIFLVLRHPGEESDGSEEDVTSLADILNGKSKNGDDEEPDADTQVASTGPSFLDAIKSAVQTPPAPVAAPETPKAGFVMTVFGPSDVKQYEWTDRNSMPTEQAVMGGAPLTPVAPNTLAPAAADPATAQPTAEEETAETDTLINGEAPPKSSGRRSLFRAW
jgi:pilus assembly protein CpaB